MDSTPKLEEEKLPPEKCPHGHLALVMELDNGWQQPRCPRTCPEPQWVGLAFTTKDIRDVSPPVAVLAKCILKDCGGIRGTDGFCEKCGKAPIRYSSDEARGLDLSMLRILSANQNTDVLEAIYAGKDLTAEQRAALVERLKSGKHQVVSEGTFPPVELVKATHPAHGACDGTGNCDEPDEYDGDSKPLPSPCADRKPIPSAAGLKGSQEQATLLSIQVPPGEGMKLFRQGLAEAVSPLEVKARKLRYDLIPAGAERAVVEALTFGAQKHGPNQWREIATEKLQELYVAAAGRHFAAYRLGETKDAESGCHPLASAICSLMFLLERDLDEQAGVA